MNNTEQFDSNSDDIEYIDLNLDEDLSDSEFSESDISFDEPIDLSKDTAEPTKHTRKKLIKEIISYVIIICIAFLVAFSINKFVIINAHVPSSSMENTISVNDKLIGNRLAYLFKDPKRGDIIIFKFPDDESQIFIKRVIGVPGDVVKITDGVLYINDEVITEDYIKEPMVGTFGPYVVPEDRYFVMGDNRNISEDSRYWTHTYVKKSQILAKAWFRYSPSFSKIE